VQRELKALCQFSGSERAFWEQVLDLLTAALGADGCAVWAVRAGQSECLALRGDIGAVYPASDKGASAHRQMVTFSSGNPMPLRVNYYTNTVLISGVVAGKGFEGTRILEFVRRPKLLSIQQQSYASYLAQLCELIGHYRVRCQSKPPAFPGRPPKPPKPSANLEHWLVDAYKQMWRWVVTEPLWIARRLLGASCGPE
jgi:hypothetical protein